MFDAVESHSQARADLAADGWRCGGADRPAQQQLTNTQVMQLVAELSLTSGNTLNRAMQLVAAGGVMQLLDHIGLVTGGSRGNNDVQRTTPGVKRFDGCLCVAHADASRRLIWRSMRRYSRRQRSATVDHRKRSSK